MNTRISKLVICLNMAAMMACSTQVLATETSKKKNIRSSQAVSQAATMGDNFQLTLSTIPYSSDPESDYVRIYCAPEKKHGKKK